MNRALAYKFGLIAAIAAVAAFFSLPPSERISLGLDLRGGAHILLQVDTDSAIRYQLELTQSRVGQELKKLGLTYESIAPGLAGVLEIRGTEPARKDDVRKVLDQQLGNWQISDLGSGSWRAEMPPSFREYVTTSAVDATLTTIRNRVDALGVSEPLTQKQGIAGDRILVQLPGVEDPERVKGILHTSAVLEWKALTYPPGANPAEWFPADTPEAVTAQFGGALPADTELYPQDLTRPDGGVTQVWWPLKRVSVVVGNDLRNAMRSTDQWGDAAVSFELSQDAGVRFESATRENLNRKMAILLDKRVLSAPVIEGVIRDQGIIRGGFDIQRAEDLALSLRSGAIPADVRIIEERTVGPSLGRDSIRSGLAAGLVGFALITLFMLLYYRLSGLNAVVALLFNVLLIFGSLGALPFLFAGMSGLRATLTLPGIAGIILTVGMAVDSNVLIFERIREELRLGKTVRSAVEQGFSRAFMTILDCNVTTVVAAIFLGLYGTGPVRGFAVTLIIGLMASMFTAVFVSRQLFELVLLRRTGNESLSI